MSVSPGSPRPRHRSVTPPSAACGMQKALTLARSATACRCQVLAREPGSRRRREPAGLRRQENGGDGAGGCARRGQRVALRSRAFNSGNEGRAVPAWARAFQGSGRCQGPEEVAAPVMGGGGEAQVARGPAGLVRPEGRREDAGFCPDMRGQWRREQRRGVWPGFFRRWLWGSLWSADRGPRSRALPRYPAGREAVPAKTPTGPSPPQHGRHWAPW